MTRAINAIARKRVGFFCGASRPARAGVSGPGQTDRQTDSCFRDRSRTPHERLCAAPPPYARTRGCAPVGSPIGWAVLLLTSTSRARTRRAPRTARTLAVLDGLGAWGGGWVGRAALCVVGGVCVPWFRRSSASCALSSAVPPPLVCRFRLLFRVGVSPVARRDRSDAQNCRCAAPSGVACARVPVSASRVVALVPVTRPSRPKTVCACRARSASRGRATHTVPPPRVQVREKCESHLCRCSRTRVTTRERQS